MDGKYWKIAFLMITQVLLAFFMLIIPTLSTMLQERFHLSSAGIGLLTTALFAGFGCFSFFTGRLSDRFNFPQAFLVGHAAIGACLLLAGFTNSFGQLMTMLFLCGFGDSLISTSSARSVIIWFPNRGRATASSIYKVGFPVGAALAALVLPQVATALSWEWVFRLVGIMLAGWGLFVYQVLINSGSRDNQLVRIRRQPGQVLPGSLKRKVYLIGLVGMLAICIQYCITTYCMLYLNRYAGYSLFFAGSILSLIQSAGIAGRLILGPVSDFLIQDRIRSMLFALVMVPVGILFLLQPGNLVFLYIGAFLVGFSIVGWLPLWLTLLSEVAPPEHVGWATGMGFAINSLGGLIGPPLFGLIADSPGGFQLAFGLLFLISLLTLGLLFLIRDRKTGA